MKILLSPAKIMTDHSEAHWSKSTLPLFLNQSEELMSVLRDLNVGELEKLMKISGNLAEINYERFHVWEAKPGKNQSLQSALAYRGDVYRGLDADSISESGQDYLNENAFIFSGLYGLLRPSDRIMPYRLSMGIPLKVQSHKNLYEFWEDTPADFLNSKLKKGEPLLNLASKEYSKTLEGKELKSPLTEVEFLDFKDRVLKPLMSSLKKARGMLTRFCAEQGIEKLEEVKGFNGGGYIFDDNLSEENRLVFVRQKEITSVVL